MYKGVKFLRGMLAVWTLNPKACRTLSIHIIIYVTAIGAIGILGV